MSKIVAPKNEISEDRRDLYKEIVNAVENATNKSPENIGPLVYLFADHVPGVGTSLAGHIAGFMTDYFLPALADSIPVVEAVPVKRYFAVKVNGSWVIEDQKTDKTFRYSAPLKNKEKAKKRAKKLNREENVNPSPEIY